MQLSKTKTVFVGLAVIIIIYSLYYKTLIYTSYYAQVPRMARQTGRLLAILLVYGAGWYVFKKYGVRWMRLAWNLIYFFVTILLILLGLADLLLQHRVPQIRSIADTLHEFLIAPILYAALLIVNRMIKNLTPPVNIPLFTPVWN